MQSQPSTVRLRSGETAVIRDLRSEDAAALYQCFCAFSEASLRVFRSQPFTLAEARMLAAQAGQPGCMRAIGLVGGEAAGYASLSWAGSTESYPMLSIGVADPFQGKGLGRKMMEHLLGWAQGRGFPGVDLWVFKDNWRALRLYSTLGFRLTGEATDQRQHTMRLSFREPSGALKRRGVQVWVGRWRFPPLTAEGWTFADWERYLQLLQSCGANGLMLYLWPSHYYLPDDARTAANEWQWRILSKVAEYAGTLALRLQIAFAAQAVPGHVWSRQTWQRAEGSGFCAPLLCWDRGRQHILPFVARMVEHFAPQGAEFCVWAGDAGWCSCRRCAQVGATVEHMVQALRRIVDGRALVHLGLGEEVLARLNEERAAGALAAALAREMLAGEALFLADREGAMLRAAQEAALPVVRVMRTAACGPEELLARPRLAQARAAVQEARGKGCEGVYGTRASPQMQFVADANMAWQVTDEWAGPAKATARLGSMLRLYGSVEESFTEGVGSMERWWSDRRLSDLERAQRCFVRCGDDEWILSLADSASAMAALARALESGETDESRFLAALRQAMVSPTWLEAYAARQAEGDPGLAEHTRAWLGCMKATPVGE